MPSSKQGFSLIEVTLALGIVSFAMVTLLALIPVGLNSFRKAMNLTVEAQIVQSISTDVGLRRFTDLQTAAGAPEKHYYDVQGTPVTSASSSDRVYTATVSFNTDLSKVGDGGLDSQSGTALVADIEVTSTVATAVPARRYTILVANNGQ